MAAIAEVFESGWLGMGSLTEDFESAIKQRLGVPEVIAVNTGTSAIHLALEGFGLSPGDQVIVPSLTYAASIQAILATGAAPVFCDVSEDTLLVDVDDVRSRLTPCTKAIMPVHYCGQPADMDALLDIATAQNCWIVEDAAHAFGSSCKGRPIGSFGHATCFSFDPIKVLTCGEGGAVTLSDPQRAEDMRRKRLLGIDKDTWHRYQNTRSWFYEVTTNGFRYHLPNFCAAVGLAQMPKLDGFIEARRTICRRYDAAFSGLHMVEPLSIDYTDTAPFTYIVKVAAGSRDAFMDHLKDHGVGSGIHYLPNHTQPYFRRFATGQLPHTERVAAQIVTLPLYSHMDSHEVDTVVEAVTSFDRARRG